MMHKEECLFSWTCIYRAEGHVLLVDIDNSSPSLWNPLKKAGKNSILYCIFVKICMLNRVATLDHIYLLLSLIVHFSSSHTVFFFLSVFC